MRTHDSSSDQHTDIAGETLALHVDATSTLRPTRVVLDTSVLVADPACLFTYVGCDVVIPLTVNAIGSRENASTGFEITGNIKLAGNSASMIEQLEKLSKDRVCLIAKLNDGTNEVLGVDNGLKFLFNRTSGVKFDDMNGVTLTFTGREKKNCPKVSDVIVAALLV